jgi:catechol 2,3-dioxygenase-like lactoylglutathione lyase family enzyme
LSRIQLALNVADIRESVGFYSRLFGAEPARRRSGYASFSIADPPLKLILIEDRTKEPGSLNHLGVEVDSMAEVEAAKVRLAGAGLVATSEGETSSRHAVEDKVWAVSPAGEPWEFHVALADAAEAGS